MMDTTAPSDLERRKQVRIRLRVDLNIEPQEHEGRTYYVVKDPVSLRYYRLKDNEHFLLQFLDGKHTLEDAQKAYEKQYRPDRLKLEDLETFAQQLLTAGLAQNEPDPGAVAVPSPTAIVAPEAAPGTSPEGPSRTDESEGGAHEEEAGSGGKAVVLLSGRFNEPAPFASAEGGAGSANPLRRWLRRLTGAWRVRRTDPVLEDWKAAWRLEETGQLDAYEGQFVAVLGGQLVGYGPHPGELREAVAHTAQIDLHRVVVMYVDAGEVYGCADSFAGSLGGQGSGCTWEPLCRNPGASRA
jgi:hypothetical protein